MKHSTLFIAMLVSFVIYGCSNLSKNGYYANQNKDSKFIFTDSLILNLDDFSTFDILFNQVANFNDKESLYIFNTVNNSLDIYDLSNGELLHRLIFSTEGPSEIRNIMNFYVHNEDSIFIYPKMTFNNTTLIDVMGNVSHKYRPTLPTTNQIARVLNHNSTSSSPTYYYNNFLFFDQLSLRSSLEPETKDFKTSGYVDLNKDSIYLFENAVYPDLYLNKSMSTNFKISSRILNRNKEWIYSWEALDSLMIFDVNMNLQKKVYAKSKFKTKEISSPISFEVRDEIKQAVEETFYSRIVTDPANNYYYRIVSIGSIYNPEMDKSVLAAAKNDFSVIVLDKDFKLLDERLFPGDTYSVFHAFATEKGLHLPKNNPNYEGLDEEKLVIDIFKLANE